MRRATFADSAILGAIIKANKQAGRRCFAVIPTLRVALDWCHPPAPADAARRMPGSSNGRLP